MANRPWLDSEGNGAFDTKNVPNFVRPGEGLQIVVINRATGYMGTQNIIIQPSGTVLEPPTPILMGPPNLKIIASREFEDYNELTRETDNTVNIIGSEGAGLTSDKYVKIQSVWLNHDGNMLPDELPGYTGRVAVSTGSDTKDFSGNFEIKPGYQTQLVQLNNANDLNTEHFYVQVVGENYDGNPSFGSAGAGEGKLQTRPEKYVPIKVPLFDEESTRAAEYELAKGKLEGIADLPERAEPVYRWVYRPEMQFSVFELAKQKLQFADESGALQVVDLSGTDEDAPILVFNENMDFIKFLYELISSDSDPLAAFGGDTQLVFSVGAEEGFATITADGTVLFENIGHIGSLVEEDFLSIRLYTNNDLANVLWQYSVEYVYIEPTIIGYEEQTDDTYYVTADEPNVELKAGVAGYAYRAEEDKYDGKMNWKVEGSGSIEELSQDSNEYGLFDNTLKMPTTKGATGDVSVTWQDASSSSTDGVIPVTWKTVEVLAGKPARIEVSQSGIAVAMEQGDVRLDYTIYDQFNNLVEDGTEIDLEFSNSLILKDQELSTEDGKAYVVLSGGEFAVANTTVTVTSEGVTKDTDVSVSGLSVALTATQTVLNKMQSTTVTATVTKPGGSTVSGVPVTLSAKKGIFAEQALTTNAQGQATTTFTAGLNEHSDSWVAQVGYVAVTELAYSVQSAGNQSINAEDAMLVGDATQAGTINFDGYGVDIDLDYETTATISVRGNIGDTIQIGDMADPNLEPLLSLALNDIEYDGVQGRFDDDHAVNPARINPGHSQARDDDITIVNDHPLGAGRSAQLKAGSRLLIAASDQIAIADNSGFRLDFKPLGNGDILSFDKEGFKLSYSNETLTLQVATDTGPYTVSVANVTTGQWHGVAANVSGSDLNLYVDGTVYTQTFSGNVTQGNPLIINSKAIQIGGMEAIVRGFRVYDYGSQPLISFADDSTATTLQANSETIGIKSLGSLGQAVTNSQLTATRVALINGSERNYASVLSQQGYQDIALNYLYTISPEVPIAAITNPLPGIVPTAHAWSWGGVWDGVKSTVGFLIPYEDFIVIGEQMMYLINQDWQNFDPTALAFASLGAATIIPIAKPLKVVLGPLKRVVDGMKRFPAARHFAGAIGTAVKSALSGKTDKLVDLLPFILIAIELFEDPEVFEFIMNAIESEDDLWVWVEYIAEVANLEGGLDLASLNSSNSQLMIAENPVTWLVPNAHAGLPRIVAKILEQIRSLVRRVPLGKAKTVTEAMRVLRNHPTLFKIALKSVAMLRFFGVVGVAKIGSFIRNSRNWRINRWFVLFSAAYLLEEDAADRLPAAVADRLAGLLSITFSNSRNNASGAMFQLSQVAYFHAKNQISGSEPAVLAIEQPRPAFRLVNGEAVGTPYGRRVDIILQEGDGENWLEVKSYVKSSFQFSPKPFVSRTTPYKEFFHDLRLNKDIINTDNKGKILTGKNDSKENDLYTWYFHQFSRGPDKANAPKKREEDKAQERLCAIPKSIPGGVSPFYDDHMKDDEKGTKRSCDRTSSTRIQLRDTETYITEIVRGLVSKDAALREFADVVDAIPASSEWY